MKNPTSTQCTKNPEQNTEARRDLITSAHIIVIGTGPVGIRAAKMLKGQNPSHKILVFGEENSAPYNRVQLSLYLHGEISRNDLFTPQHSSSDEGIDYYIATKIISINKDKKTIIDQNGNTYHYDKLILATGSKAVIPDIPGNTLVNTLTFRTIEDTDNLITRKSLSHSVFIIGSGPLGIEAAIGMKTRDNRVYLQARNYLLDSSLDQKAQEVLADNLSTAGIQVIENDNITSIIG